MHVCVCVCVCVRVCACVCVCVFNFGMFFFNLCRVELSNCPFYCVIGVTQKQIFFYVFIMNNKVPLFFRLVCCY